MYTLIITIMKMNVFIIKNLFVRFLKYKKHICNLFIYLFFFKNLVIIHYK